LSDKVARHRPAAGCGAANSGPLRVGRGNNDSVVVLYPNKAGSKFDLDYCVRRHLPLVRDRLQPMGMRSLAYTVEHAMDPKAPPQAYRLSAELRFDDMESAARA
jgi:hypothetical protein